VGTTREAAASEAKSLSRSSLLRPGAMLEEGLLLSWCETAVKKSVLAHTAGYAVRCLHHKVLLSPVL